MSDIGQVRKLEAFEACNHSPVLNPSKITRSSQLKERKRAVQRELDRKKRILNGRPFTLLELAQKVETLQTYRHSAILLRIVNIQKKFRFLEDAPKQQNELQFENDSNLYIHFNS